MIVVIGIVGTVGGGVVSSLRGLGEASEATVSVISGELITADNLWKGGQGQIAYLDLAFGSLPLGGTD